MRVGGGVGIVTAGAATVGAAVAGALCMLLARGDGVAGGTSSPTLAGTGLLGVLVLAVFGVLLRVRYCLVLEARRVLAVAAVLAGYLVLCGATALAVGGAELRGPTADWIVALQVVGWVPALTALQLLVLAGGRDLGAEGARSVQRLLVGSAVAGTVLGFVVVDPGAELPGVAAPLAALDATGVGVAFGVACVTWMLAVLGTPAVLGRSIARGTTDLRRRLALLTCAAVVPVWTIAVCLVLTVAVGTEGRAPTAGVEILAAAFGVPFVLATPLVVLAHVAAGQTLGRVTPAVVGIAFTIALGGLVGVGAAAAGVAAVSVWPGGPVFAVLATVAAAAVLGLLRRRWQGALRQWLDPDRARALALLDSADTADFLLALERLTGSGPVTMQSSAASLLDRLSPREAEVLALISEGRSNGAVAAELVVSERTVDTHVRSIFAKLELSPDADANRRVQAAAYWIRATTGNRQTGASPDGGGGSSS